MPSPSATEPAFSLMVSACRVSGPCLPHPIPYTLDRLGVCTERRVPRPPIGVDAGRGLAFIDHIGEVFPSGFLPLPCGSVHDVPFSEIYRTSPTMQRLRRTDEFSGKCGVCEYNSICGGSRARTHAMTGDAFSSDPSCP